MELNFNGAKLQIVFGEYAAGGTSIRLTEDGIPYMTATICDPDMDIKDDEVIIKNYSENEGILEALEDAGIIQHSYLLNYGMVNIVVCKLLVNPTTK